jgi:undecaprenyl phosphate-alpha-L-ara4FN deformylase
MTTALGLRVDVDTFRGTRDGVPQLLDALARHGVRATFFFSVGPDNMGRHLWRLVRPAFLAKMIRSRAASLYGWDVLLAGTLWPGRRIAAALGGVIRATAAAGHEIGLHAWDHHRWQAAARRMSVAELTAELGRGMTVLGDLLGRAPDCSAAAGWVCNERVLEAKEAFGFRYNSDCRGRNVFVPILGGRRLTPQIPTTLPTYDELIGSEGVTDGNYNSRLLDSLRADRLNVLTIHAEVEGVARTTLFAEFLDECKARHVRLQALGDVLTDNPPREIDAIAQAPVAGRDGDVCWQRSALVH